MDSGIRGKLKEREREREREIKREGRERNRETERKKWSSRGKEENKAKHAPYTNSITLLKGVVMCQQP